MAPAVPRWRGDRGYRRWLAAYRIALVNASVFVAFALINEAFDVPIAAHAAAAALFGAGSFYAFYRLCQAGGSLAAVSFFVFGSGTIFGFGTLGSIYARGPVFRLLFSAADQLQTLPTINLMNGLSVWIVLVSCWFVAWPSRAPVGGNGAPATLATLLETLQVFRLPAVALSAAYFLLYVHTFPVAHNLLLRNLVSRLYALPLLVIFLSFSTWRRLSLGGRAIAVSFALIMAVFGFLEAAKTPVVLAILAVIGGLFIAGSRRAAAVICAVAVVFYFAVLSGSVTRMRLDPAYELVKNTLSQRATIMVRAVTATDRRDEIAPSRRAPSYDRFLEAPFQAYLINEWWEGRPGNSLRNAWAAMIPRILWPGKPIITRFAGELYGQIFFQDPSRDGSAQAPTYTAEAFWNYGWLGVILISLIIGLEIGWFTRKWLRCVYDGSPQLGVVIFALPIVFTSAWVESWIAATYVGGFLTLFVLVKVGDLIGPWARSIAQARAARRARDNMPVSA